MPRSSWPAAAAAAEASATPEPSPATEAPTVAPTEAAAEAGAYVADVREPKEYAEGHIPGAINIPLRTLTQNLDKIPTDQPVIVYCASGLRAGSATAALKLLGYENVRSFAGGWKAWSGAGEEASTEAVEAATVTPKEVDAEALAAADEFLVNIPERLLLGQRCGETQGGHGGRRCRSRRA